MAHKDGARVHDKAQLLVRGLERGQVLRAEVRVQVTGLDPGELGQVVHHLQQSSTQCRAEYFQGLSHETDLVGPYLLKKFLGLTKNLIWSQFQFSQTLEKVKLIKFFDKKVKTILGCRWPLHMLHIKVADVDIYE